MSDLADDLDGCQALLEATDGYDDAQTAALRPLFPRGEADAALADEWLELFADCGLNVSEHMEG